MDLVLKNKKTVIALALLLIVFFLYSALFAPEPEEIRTPAVVPGEDLLSMANKLSSINFNQELFSMRGYRALTDFSVAIPEEATGRTDPFEAIGR